MNYLSHLVTRSSASINYVSHLITHSSPAINYLSHFGTHSSTPINYLSHFVTHSSPIINYLSHLATHSSTPINYLSRLVTHSSSPINNNLYSRITCLTCFVKPWAFWCKDLSYISYLACLIVKRKFSCTPPPPQKRPNLCLVKTKVDITPIVYNNWIHS